MLFVLSLFLFRRRRRGLFGFIKSERKSSHGKKNCSSKVRRTRIFRREKLLYETHKKERKKKTVQLNWVCQCRQCVRAPKYETTLEWFLFFLCLFMCVFYTYIRFECVCVLTTIHAYRTKMIICLPNSDMSVYGCVYILNRSLADLFVRTPVNTYKPKNVCVRECVHD